MDGILPEATYRLNAERAEAYEQQLYSSKAEPILEYLMEERGLTVETLKHFHVGAVIDPDPVDQSARGRVCIPHLNMRGISVLRFRAMPGVEGPKYWQPPGSHVDIYNVVELAVPRAEIAVTEGEIDCMTLHQAGIPAVGFPGVSSFKDYYRHLFEGYRQVTICADNDDKGQGAGFAEKLATKVPGPRPILMPEGHDVNSFYMAAGREALRHHLKVKDPQ